MTFRDYGVEFVLLITLDGTTEDALVYLKQHCNRQRVFFYTHKHSTLFLYALIVFCFYFIQRIFTMLSFVDSLL